MGYYWPKMMTEVIAYAKRCHACQVHGDFVHRPPEQLHPPANGLAEAFNKTIRKLLNNFVSHTKCDWDEKLNECLWAYCSTVRTPTKAIPFSLVYGAEAVLPLEIQIPSLRVALASQMTEEDKHQARLRQLEALDAKRLQAQQQIELYQARISKAYNRKVRERTFEKGDSCAMAHGYDTQDQGQIPGKVGKTICGRVHLFKRGLPLGQC